MSVLPDAFVTLLAGKFIFLFAYWHVAENRMLCRISVVYFLYLCPCLVNITIGRMEHTIYSYSLCTALSLMLFFGFYFIFARTPDKAIFTNYLRSRRIMAAALLLLAANYLVHFFFQIRFASPGAAVMMNLSTYFLCYWLFSSALMTLLNRFYITRWRFATHLALWVVYSLLACLVMFWLPQGPQRSAGLLVLALCLVAYGIFLASRLMLTYRRAVRIFNDTHSDDIGTYIKWLSIFTYWAVIFGVGCGLLTFLPDEYIYVWILSSIPFYIYLFSSYMNYLLFYEKVESAFETEISSEEDIMCAVKSVEPEKEVADVPLFYTVMASKVNEWIACDGYLTPGVTIKELADRLQTNRTYLSEYIKTTYETTFRDWIGDLRIAYAKRLLVQNPQLTLADISEKSGFLSYSHFMKTFKEKEGCTPARWKKEQTGNAISSSTEKVL